MDIRYFEYFVTVYKEKSITAASRRLSISQQGLSKAIQNMEQEFQAALFFRNKNRLTPTPFGEVFYQESLHLIAEYNRFTEALRLSRKNLCSLKLGLAPNVVNVSEIGSRIAAFQSVHSELELMLVYENDDVCEQKVENGELNAAIIMGPLSSSSLDSFFLSSEQIFALLHRRHPLTEKASLTLTDLQEEPLITASAQSKGYHALLESFEPLGHDPNIVFQANDPILHMNLVEKGLGISLYPEQWQSFFQNFNQVITRTVSGIRKRDILLVTRTSASAENPNIKALIQALT